MQDLCLQQNKEKIIPLQQKKEKTMPEHYNIPVLIQFKMSVYNNT